jgi:DNA invertase Pin-like site-specific DNA recombinase
MRCAIYARVSTTDQNCEMQLRELREYISRREWKIAGEYVDTGFSGAKASRPALDCLMADAAKRKFDCIVVYKIDRFGRSVLHLNQQLAALTNHGVRFIATSQNIDTDESNPAARFLLHILMAAAEFERELIRERSQAGLKRYRQDYGAGRVGKEVRSRSGKNLPVGRPRRIFDRHRITELRQTGLSPRQIARQTGLGEGTVRRVLRASTGTMGTRQNPTAGIL